MITGSNEVLSKNSARDIAIKNLAYVEGRMNGTITSLRTKFPRFDNNLMDGIEKNSIMTISAPSGGGKSTLAKCIIDSISEYNPDVLMNIYNFNFELTTNQTASRTIVTEADISLRELYSADEALTPEKFTLLKKYYKKLAERDNYFFIDVPSDPATIVNSMWNYYIKECKPHGKMIVTCIDHTLLLKDKTGKGDKHKIDELMNLLIAFKKNVDADGGDSLTIVLSQMNRDIYTKERILNTSMHRPKASDLHSSGAIEFASDYILFAHAPGKLNLQSYTEKNYPTFYNIDGKTKFMIYFELIKNRSGEAPITIPMLNSLNRFDMDEMNLNSFNDMYKEFRELGVCEYKTTMFQ